MMKRLFVAAILALATMSIADVAVASAPFPGCYPCPTIDSAERAVIGPVQGR